MLRRMYSWLLGYTIGQVRHDKNDRFIEGNIFHLLDESMKDTLKIKIAEYKWTGFTWKKVGYRVFLYNGEEWYPSLTLITSLLGEV